MAVDPRFYVVHVIYFTLGAILFGFFAAAHRKETLQNGWGITPRLVWLTCICCSSFGFLIVQLDPVGAIGIFSDPWQLFVGAVDASLLVGSVCASIYMYLLVSYKGDSLPMVTYIWLGSNVGALSIVFVLALTEAITDNMFWNVLTLYVIVLQEVCIFLGLSIAIFKITRVLRSQLTDYRKHIRKLWIIMACSTAIIVAAIVNQTLGITTPAKAWGMRTPVTDLETFQFKLITADLLTIVAHATLLFMTRPMSNREPPTRVVRVTEASEVSQDSRAIRVNVE